MGLNNHKPLASIQYWPTVTLKSYAPGDLVYENGSGAILQASEQTDQLTEAANQALFARKFIGVCNGQKLSTDSGTQAIPVIVEEEYEFTLDAATTVAVGDFLGADEQSNGTQLENQQVKKVTNADYAIAQVTRAGTSVTKAWARILSKTRSRGGALRPFIPSPTQQALSGAGAVNVTSFLTAYTSTGAAQALTLANGLVVGQLKKIIHVVDGGSGVLTPTSLSGGTTITFTTVGEFALLLWDGAAWNAIELANSATPGTPPALA